MPGREVDLRRGGEVASSTLGATVFFIAASEPASATSRISSMVRTGFTVSFEVTCSGISASSGAFAAGISAVVIPARAAASSFSFNPPIGSTFRAA